MSERAVPAGVDPAAWRSFLDARREAEAFASRSEAEREAEIVAVLQAGLALLEGRPDREEMLCHRDPLPAETRDLLERLKAAWSERRDP